MTDTLSIILGVGGIISALIGFGILIINIGFTVKPNWYIVFGGLGLMIISTFISTYGFANNPTMKHQQQVYDQTITRFHTKERQYEARQASAIAEMKSTTHDTVKYRAANAELQSATHKLQQNKQQLHHYQNQNPEESY